MMPFISAFCKRGLFQDYQILRASKKLSHNAGVMSIFIVQVHGAVYAMFGEEGYIQVDSNERRNMA
jgi:hypothetical protein